MSDIAALVAGNLDIWTSATQRKSSAGRGGGKRISLYGIERLRALILDLAVRGKLVPQDAGDEPAARLLARITVERKALQQAGKISKPKILLPIGLDELSVPQTWVATRFGAVFSLEYGDNLPEPKRTGSGEYNVFGSNGVVGTHDSFTVDQPCLVVGRKGSAGAVNKSQWPCWVTDVAYYCVPPTGIDLDFQYILFRTLGLDELGKGIKPGLNRNEANVLAVPLPPLAEQRRIVTKVDELMALCDALERESADAMAAHQVLVKELLATLVNSADAADLAANWARLEIHFDTLFTTDASVEVLEQTILDLAVRGKLVDEDAANWPVEPLGKYVKEAAAGWSPKCIETPRSGDNWGVLKVSAVTWGRFQPEENKELPSSLEPRPEIEVAPGDFLISRANTAELVARSVVVPLNAPRKLMMSDKIIRFRFNDKIDPEYVNLVHASPFARAYYARVAGGTSSSMKNVSQSQIRALEIPIPPLAEQHRIVAKVGELLALCNALKAQLADAAETHRHLADAIVERAAA